MSVIRIEIDMNSLDDMMPDGYGDDDNFVCPVPQRAFLSSISTEVGPYLYSSTAVCLF